MEDLKFISWNVNGLRAIVSKGFVDIVENLDADFFCLQEIKLQEGQLDLEIPGYEAYYNYAERKGYSGTAIFTRHTPLNVFRGIDIPEHDTEGRVLTLEFDKFFLVTVYTPNSKDTLERLDYRQQWDDAFRDYILRLDKQKPVIICGDLNVAHKEIDLVNPEKNRRCAGFTDEERAGIEKLLGKGFVDTFRHFNPDVKDAFTWWSYKFRARERNNGWRIDYFLVSERLLTKLKSASIHSHILGSDHCPVEIVIAE